MNTTLTTVLYTSKTLSDGTHPLMLRLSKNRRIKYISLHISLDAKFWDFDKSRPKRNCPDKERINTLIEYKSTFLGIPVTRSLTLRGVQTPPVWACPTYGFQNNFLGSLSGSFLGSERFGDYPQNKLDEKRATKFVIFGVMV